jgi:hypothetical protein
MPRVGFEPTIPASKRAKTVHLLNHPATVAGLQQFTIFKFLTFFINVTIHRLINWLLHV